MGGCISTCCSQREKCDIDKNLLDSIAIKFYLNQKQQQKYSNSFEKSQDLIENKFNQEINILEGKKQSIFTTAASNSQSQYIQEQQNCQNTNTLQIKQIYNENKQQTVEGCCMEIDKSPQKQKEFLDVQIMQNDLIKDEESHNKDLSTIQELYNKKGNSNNSIVELDRKSKISSNLMIRNINQQQSDEYYDEIDFQPAKLIKEQQNIENIQEIENNFDDEDSNLQNSDIQDDEANLFVNQNNEFFISENSFKQEQFQITQDLKQFYLQQNDFLNDKKYSNQLEQIDESDLNLNIEMDSMYKSNQNEKMTPQRIELKLENNQFTQKQTKTKKKSKKKKTKMFNKQQITYKTQSNSRIGTTQISQSTQSQDMKQVKKNLIKNFKQQKQSKDEERNYWKVPAEKLYSSSFMSQYSEEFKNQMTNINI